jgi:hypothetical protein
MKLIHSPEPIPLDSLDGPALDRALELLSVIRRVGVLLVQAGDPRSTALVDLARANAISFWVSEDGKTAGGSLKKRLPPAGNGG